ncbi:MAG: amidohydrolase family protein [Lentisphaeria bacterium]|nr:amidohydrolase family protein [Lentisphaeria bacterium]
MKIIDAHNHPDWWGHDLAKTLANMDANNISQAWILSWECGANEFMQHYHQAFLASRDHGPIPFERCVAYKEKAPERFIIGYAPDARDPNACRRLRAAHDIYGAKVCGEVKCRAMYDNPDFLRMFRTAGELGMPVTLHFDYDRQFKCDDERVEWWGGTIKTLENVLAACPDTNFLGHAPGFWVHISGDDIWKVKQYPAADDPIPCEGEISRLLRQYPNLFCDISAGSGCTALSRDISFTKKFLTEFQDRVVYARDYFDTRHQDLLRTLDLPVEIMEKIYCKNAERLIENA